MGFARHVVIRLENNRPLFTQRSVRRMFSRTVARLGRPFDVVCWGAGDNDAHIVVIGDEATANELARRVEHSLTKQLRLRVGFQKPSNAPIFDQAHLESTIRYVHRQAERHGVDDAFHEGSSLPDAAGRRALMPELPARLARTAPRVNVVAHAGPLGDVPADPGALAQAAAAAIGRKDLVGREPIVIDARRAVLHFAPEASVSELIAAMGGSRRGMTRLRKRPLPSPVLLAAVEAQARWRAAPPNEAAAE